MSIKYAFVSTLMFGLLATGLTGVTSATTHTKDNKKHQENPAVTLVSSTIQKSVEKKKEDNKKKSPSVVIGQDYSQSGLAIDALAYHPTHWKPTSYMGNTRHCSRRSSANRRYVPMMIG